MHEYQDANLCYCKSTSTMIHKQSFDSSTPRSQVTESQHSISLQSKHLISTCLYFRLRKPFLYLRAICSFPLVTPRPILFLDVYMSLVAQLIQDNPPTHFELAGIGWSPPHNCVLHDLSFTGLAKRFTATCKDMQYISLQMRAYLLSTLNHLTQLLIY